MRALLSCFLSFSGKVISTFSPLVMGESLRVFVNTLSTDGKYPVRDCQVCNSQFKCNYLKNKKLFLDFFFHFMNLHQISIILKENMMVIANVLPKLTTIKNLFRTISKRSRFRACFDSQHVRVSQILSKSTWEHSYRVFHHSQ